MLLDLWDAADLQCGAWATEHRGAWPGGSPSAAVRALPVPGLAGVPGGEAFPEPLLSVQCLELRLAVPSEQAKLGPEPRASRKGALAPRSRLTAGPFPTAGTRVFCFVCCGDFGPSTPLLRLLLGLFFS